MLDIIFLNLFTLERLFKMDITIQLEDILDRAKERFESDSNENLFEQSLQEFKQMVESVIVKHRGYNIRTIDHEVTSFQFNKSPNNIII